MRFYETKKCVLLFIDAMEHNEIAMKRQRK